jgi:hypothetical protein
MPLEMESFLKEEIHEQESGVSREPRLMSPIYRLCIYTSAEKAKIAAQKQQQRVRPQPVVWAIGWSGSPGDFRKSIS